MSCFICEVVLDKDTIELIDSGHHSFYIYRSNDDVMKQFKEWFVSIYKACVPQTLTVVQYTVEDNDGDPEMRVDKLFYKSHASVTMLNESADAAKNFADAT